MRFASIWHRFLNTGFFSELEENDPDIRESLKMGDSLTGREGPREARKPEINGEYYGDITARSLDLSNP